MTQTIIPSIRYRDANRAIEWLCAAFGFAENAVYRDDAGVVEHAQLELGGSMIMLGEVREGDWQDGTSADPRDSVHGIYVVVSDPRAHHERAVAAGAEVFRELVDQDYGGSGYSARDCEGNAWSFGSYDPFA